MIILPDDEIQALLREEKAIPLGLYPLKAMPELHHHRRKNCDVSAESGHEFVEAVRQSSLNVMDFPVILGYKLPGVFTVFRQRRYNGSSQHSNTFEKETIDGFHVHTPTERYQQMAGFKEDYVAELTNRYSDSNAPIECLLNECSFRSPIEKSPLTDASIVLAER
jgi:hypothetical protein